MLEGKQKRCDLNINETINSLFALQGELTNSWCFVNGQIAKLADIEKMGYDEFSTKCRLTMPLKLYKYFSNKECMLNGRPTNYSIQALQNNTVYMQTPTEFDDVYDSEISVDNLEYERLRLIEYCRRCNLSTEGLKTVDEIGNLFIRYLLDSFNEFGNFENIFRKEITSELEDLSNRLFINQLLIELESNNDLGQVIPKILQGEFKNKTQNIKKTFRTSCFATTPHSQLMWGGAYADFHKGFCLEYTVLPDNENYKKIFYNLFPVIYSKIRANLTSFIAAQEDTEITNEYVWNLYFNGALRKSIDWAYQNEWRLLLPIKSDDPKDLNVKFFPITKVYLGNRMNSNERKKIIDICKEKQIPYIGVKRSQNYFEMLDCEIKCEDCYQYKRGLEEKMEKDNRVELQDKIDELMKTESFIDINKVNSKSYGTNTNFKLGLYYLYDKNDEIIYIGKVGSGGQTSFYSRMIGHGSGAHNKQEWYKEVVKCKFHRFDNFNDSEIELLERLAIQKHCPKYNDKNLSKEVINSLYEKIEMQEKINEKKSTIS